jgi:hypothetical protein
VNAAIRGYFWKKRTRLKKTLIASLVALASWLTASSQYWQQELNYKIDVSLNDKNHSLKGVLNLEYVNHSPDKLDFIWFHLWPNAYKNEQTAYAKQILREKDGRDRWNDMKDKGFIDSLAFTVNGAKARIEADPQNIDIVKLVLPKSLQPGEKINISTPFYVKLPTYASRSGHLDQSYMICQWYPKPAVYDRKGWHPMPYLDQGEFYSDFGSFNVNITVPSAYVVGSTGTMQNADELNAYKEIGKKNIDSTTKPTKYSAPAIATKTLQYKASNVHDFAWFADKDFIVRYDTAQLSNNTVVDVFTYGHEGGNPHWKKSVAYVEDAIRSYSGWIGEYPYPVAQAVEGPKNAMSGGMEYPMITLITSPEADEPQMDAVITHEVGHNWFYGILASNERDHAWMDEGMNTYYQFRYEAKKYRANSVFGASLPEGLKAIPLDQFLTIIYGAMSEIPMDDPIETPSANFPNKDQYGLIVYIKTAVWMFIMQSAVGEQSLDKAMQAFYQEWKFKHPYPEDLKAIFEKQQWNVNVAGLFALLNKKGKLE